MQHAHASIQHADATLCCCSKVEVKLEGEGPWTLPDGSTDVELIHTPGHTTGHVVLLYKPERTLFSGDHWGYSGWEDCGSLFRYGIKPSLCCLSHKQSSGCARVELMPSMGPVC